MSKFFDLSDFFDSEGRVRITENGCKNLMDLANIVLNTHYSYVSPSDREDLVQVGLLKCLTLLSETQFDPSRSSLKNYLYTGIRNEMKNYLYKNSKEVSVDDEILYGINEDPDAVGEMNVSLIRITRRAYDPILARFEKKTPGTRDKVLSSLVSLGFAVEDRVLRAEYFPEAEKLVALVIWKHMEISS